MSQSTVEFITKPVLVGEMDPDKDWSVNDTSFFLLFQCEDTIQGLLLFSSHIKWKRKQNRDMQHSVCVCGRGVKQPQQQYYKTIPIYQRPRRREGFGIHCQILCIIKQIPHPPTQPHPRLARGIFMLLCLSDSRCLLQYLSAIRPESGSHYH